MRHAVASAVAHVIVWAAAAAVYTGTAVLVLRTLRVIP
jgi:hypothetical protein